MQELQKAVDEKEVYHAPECELLWLQGMNILETVSAVADVEDFEDGGDI